MFFLVLLFSFGLTLVGMPAVLRLSHAVGAVDVPDGERRRHARPTPRLGGLWVFSVFFLSVCLSIPLSDGRITALLSCAGVLVAAGVVDDVRTLSPLSKLLLQAAAVIPALLTLPLPRALTLLGVVLPLSYGASFALFLLLCIGCINAVNLIDGVDGLCGGVMAAVLLAISLTCLRRGDITGAQLALALCTPQLAFLLYNRAPAVIFLGDAGAQLLGFAAFILLLPQDGAPQPAGTLLYLALPLTELLVSILRRLRHGKNPLRADCGHLHQRLLQNGMTQNGVALAYTALSAACCLVGYGLTFPA